VFYSALLLNKTSIFAARNIPAMIKQFVLSISLFVSAGCLAQQADSSSNGIDSEIRKDPTTFPEEIIELAQIKVPASLAGFSGIRFVDIRADTSCIGYVKLWGNNKKIVFVNGLVNELNTKQTTAQNNPSGDSLIIFIKKFWVTRIIDPEKINKDEEADVTKRKERRGPKSFCHITVAYFVKNVKGLYYSGKLDTITLTRKRLLRCYDDMADGGAAFMLEQASISPQQNPRYFTEAQVQEALSKPFIFPGAETMPDGIFLSYADFKAGKILRVEFTLTPRISGYKAELDNVAGGDALTNFWGICFKNQFYVKHDYFVTKLIKSGNTFVTLFGYIDFDEEAATYLRSRDQSGQIKALNKVTDSKYKKSDYDFVPMILDLLTGRLE
jgi:hypothetical protein